MQNIEEKILQLKTIEDSITSLSEQKESLRKELFHILENEKMDQFKNEIATISKFEKTIVKYRISKEEIIKKLGEEHLDKYLEVVPEHAEINKKFEEDVKNGDVKFEGVEIVQSSYPMIRFN